MKRSNPLVASVAPDRVDPEEDQSGEAPLALRLLSDARPCGRCGRSTATGLVGYQGEEPLCGSCLLDRSPALGLVVHLVSISRWSRRLRRESPEDPEIPRTFYLFLDAFDLAMENQGLDLFPLDPSLDNLLRASADAESPDGGRKDG